MSDTGKSRNVRHHFHDVTSKVRHPVVAPGFRTAQRLAQGSDNGLPIFLANCRAERQERVG